MTIELFREDGYLKSCDAEVIAVAENSFATDQTVFYPMGGGQPGDIGTFSIGGSGGNEIADTVKSADNKCILHYVAEGTLLPKVGDKLILTIDWERRHRLMRMHSCMHMLCAAIPEPVTGGSISDGVGRLDFNLPNPPDRQVIEEALNLLIKRDVPMALSWISDDEMDQNQDLIRTMSVKPPQGSGRVRLVNFEGIDLQPCGGTHVARSGEIGPVRIQSIKNKGKQNRRVTVEFA